MTYIVLLSVMLALGLDPVSASLQAWMQYLIYSGLVR